MASSTATNGSSTWPSSSASRCWITPGAWPEAPLELDVAAALPAGDVQYPGHEILGRAVPGDTPFAKATDRQRGVVARSQGGLSVGELIVQPVGDVGPACTAG